MKKLKYLCESQGRIGFKGYSTSDLVDADNGALVFGASQISWEGNISIDNPVFISWKKYYESPEIMVKQGDVLIVQRGSTCGKVGIVSNDFGPATINPSLVLLKNIRCYSEYFFLAVKCVLSGLLNQINNTAIPMLSQFQLDNIKLCIPPINEQEMIVKSLEEKMHNFEDNIEVQLQQIEKLQEFKQTLIAHAVTGKIKV